MAEVDTSIYKPQPRPDVMGRLGGLVSTGNAMLQGQLARQQVDANQGIGDAYKAGIDADGNFDANAVARAIKSGAADPGYETGAVLSSGNAVQQGATTNAKDQSADVWAGLGSAALTDQGFNHQKAVNFINGLNRTGRITPTMQARMLKDLPPTDDPAELRQYIATRTATTLPQGGATLTPGPVTGSGAPTETTTGGMVGKIIAGQPGAPPGGNVAPVGSTVPRPSGAQPGAAGGGVVQTGLGVGAAATMQASVDQFNEDRRAAGSYQAVYAPLSQAIESLKKIGPSGTGPGTPEVNAVKGLIQAFAPNLLSKEQLDSLVDYQKASKNLEQIAAAQAQAVGPHTNAGLDAAFAGNASLDKTQAANLAVLDKATSLYRMKVAQQAEYQRQGGDPSRYSEWAQGDIRNQDPRAYGVDLMTKKQQQDLYKGLSPTERKVFNASLRRAIDNGLVSEEAIANAK